MKLAMVALTAVLVSACAPPAASECDGSFTYSGFDDGQRVQFANVRRRWTRFTGRSLDLVETPDVRPTCHISPGPLQEGMSAAFFETSRGRRFIVLDLAKLGPVFEPALLHELGHESGMAHVTERGSIMSESTGPDWTELDRAECVRVGVCD